MFEAESHVNPRFAMSSLGGLFVLLCFPPEDPAGRAAAIAAVERHRSLFDDERITAFVVLRDRAEYAARGNEIGLRWFLDETGALRELYGAGEGLWVMLDPMQRVLAFVGMEYTERVFADLARRPPAEQHAGVEVVAPVLTVPRVLEPDLCRRLIDFYNADGGAPSGTMRQEGGQTVGVFSDFKRRRDALIQDEAMRAEIRTRLRLRLLPEIAKAFQFKVTRVERYIVACYDASDGGYFRPHRDNTTTATAHRKFAVSINLNEDFEGGDLRFPEFGRRTYRPPAGGAVVFSCSLLHEATPVTRGTRYATLPFLYDEDGAQVRAGNLHTLAEGATLEG
jgi:predicted 2-oxoglutarate/Fe(II)-dependent dioxygenase YbiX